MVARTWNWDTPFMLQHYGWKAVVGILISTSIYYLFFRKELASLAGKQNQTDAAEQDGSETPWGQQDWPVPAWITIVHLLFMGWTVFFSHYPVFFIGGFLFFLAFVTTTFHHQEDVKLKPALLVGFFLAGLVTHGGLQQWWIEPVLSSLSELPLMIGATVLTAFNDNAAITYLASLVPDFTDQMKYAVVAGAVTGGGLTVIANAPNPAGQSILQRFFDGGVSPLGLALGALIPTIILGVCFMAMPF
jgi:Na+/H+ antiporter NhaD/arsenite permease-like protein